MGRYDDRVAVVTGGANGLGRAIVSGLVDEGARVAVVDLVPAKAFAGHDAVRSHTGDIGDPELVPGVIADTVKEWGKVDLLVNDAAEYPNGRLFEMSLAEWQKVFAVNVFSTVAAIRAFAEHCIGRGASDAAIVNISTGSVASPRPAGAAYASSKAAVEVLSKTYAMELGPQGIRVNVVAPGYIDVREWSDAHPDRAPDELRAALVDQIPLGVAGDPRNIADAVLFLGSAAASHINGVVLPVDGGSLAGRFSLGGHR
ncbi:MAG TPA: SDR family oxidoreductase [Mycobacteriales bacterium]|nr:SDR family oxidoreductase [Mycobacteriales bacterium]